MSGVYGEGVMVMLDAEQPRGGATPPGWPPVSPQNGSHGLSGPVVATPIQTVTVKLTGIYEGQLAVMRANPRRSVVRGLSSGEDAQMFPALAALVISWNLGDEDGQPVAPTAENIGDLPDKQMAMLLNGYFEEVRKLTEVPLPSDAASATS